MRTKKSILNFLTDAIPFIILGVLGFIKIRLFIDVFGVEVNSLVQLATQVFAYLALAEAGFGTAVIYKLYEPLANKNKEQVKSIVKGSIAIFRKIGIIIFIGGLVVSIVTPFVIKTEELAPIFISIVFFLYSIQYLVDYMFGLPYHTLLQADQNKYIVNTFRNGFKIIFRIIEVILITIGFNLIMIILIDIFVALISNLLIIRKTKKEYSWLNFDNVEADNSAVGITKDVFVHKISSIIFSKTDILILSIFLNLTAVTIYAAYEYIAKFLTEMMSRFFTAVSASFGNIFAEKKNTNDTYYEMLAFSFWSTIIICATFQFGINAFISIWIGNEFVLPFITSFLFTIIIFGRILIKPIYVIRDANGLFKESKMFTIMQAVCNIVLSIIFVQFWGIFGVLLATVISSQLILIPFNVKLTYKKVLDKSIFDYYKWYIISFGLFLILYYINQLVLNIVSFDNIWVLILIISIVFVINIIVITIIFYIINKDFKKFVKRFLK
jgi:O-antigen/teichoic acid export membrane protein